MEAQTLITSLSPSLHKPHFAKPSIFKLPQPNTLPTIHFTSITSKKFPKFRTHSTPSSSSSSTFVTEKSETDIKSDDEQFDWYSQWYPVMPVCDLDRKVPHGKKVMGIDVVVWWDRNENKWKVFDDMCPHRLAPLSEGRIDQWGRLQCVYHGWCFGGSGDCKFIPQAPPDGPPVHTSRKACVAVYPSTVQNGMVWFWPNSDPQYKDILEKKKPPYVPEIDDPSYTKILANRDIPYGYEVLVENLMDPAHVPYAHYKILDVFPPPEIRVHADREGGMPIDMNLLKLDVNGFAGKHETSNANFYPPCLYCSAFNMPSKQGGGSTSSIENSEVPQRKAVLVFFCIPVSPGNSRLIWMFPRNFGLWIEKVVPHWLIHPMMNLIIDSDLYLLHVEEQKIMEVGASNWQKACFVPTKSDAFVIGFRKWLNKYAGGGVDWRGKYTGALPPSPPREMLLDRFKSHVLNCSSCKAAYKGLNALEVILQVISISLIGIVAATKQNLMSSAMRITTLLAAVACFAVSKWLAHFIYKNFHYHDYNHALV